MKTRRISYVNNMCNFSNEKTTDCRKTVKSSAAGSPAVTVSGQSDFLDTLPDDIVLCILSKVGSTAGCPADFISVLSTCKRLNTLGVNSLVLSKVAPETFAVKSKNWSESAHRFLKRCSDAGNVEACYTLGMIRFYCMQNRGSGASLMAKAAINSHAPALYSLAVIQFNGSGGSKTDKDLRAGVALCARAAFLGHIDALRELGHCLQDGYGVRQNIAEGRRFLVQANAHELAAVLSTTSSALVSGNWMTWNSILGDGNVDFHSYRTSRSHHVSMPELMLPHHQHGNIVGPGSGCPLLSDFGCNVPAPEPLPANQFLSEWFSDKVLGSGLRLCSHAGCGRPETRQHEFRRCSVCGTVNYCSRACQALDWKIRHKMECTQAERLVGDGAGDDEDNDNVDENEGMYVES